MSRKKTLVVVMVLLLVASAGCSSINVDGVGGGTSGDSDLAFAPGLSGGIAGFGGGINLTFTETFIEQTKTTDSYVYEGTWTEFAPKEDVQNVRMNRTITVRKSGGELYSHRVEEVGWASIAKGNSVYRPSASVDKPYWQYAKFDRLADGRVVQLAARYVKIAPANPRGINDVVKNRTPAMAILKAGGGSFGYEGTMTFQGTPVHEYSINSIDRLDAVYELQSMHGFGTYGENMIEGVSGTVLIDEDGLVRKVSYTLQTPQGEVSGHVEATQVGNVTSEQVEPEWFDEGEQKALEIKNFNITQDRIKIEFAEGGEPINGGSVKYTTIIGGEKKGASWEYEEIRADFDKTFGGGDTMYITWDNVNKETRVTHESIGFDGLVRDNMQTILIKTNEGRDNDTSVDALRIYYKRGPRDITNVET